MASPATACVESASEHSVGYTRELGDYAFKRDVFRFFKLAVMYFHIIKYDKDYQPSFDRSDHEHFENLFRLQPIDRYILENTNQAFFDGVGVVMLSSDSQNIIGSL